MLKVSLTPTGNVSFKVEPDNAEGQPVPDTLSWSASPDGLVTLTPDSAPSLACLVTGTGTGTPSTPCVISVTDGKISNTIEIDFLDETVAALNVSILSGPNP